MINEDWVRSVDEALYRLQEMMPLNVVKVEPRWVGESIVTHQVILLNDVLQMFRVEGMRINFSVDGEGKDVTDIVNAYRNASCHFGSKSRQMNSAVRVSFLTIVGRSVGIRTPDGLLENPFVDDVAYFYGNIRVFYKRHLVRAVAEASEKLKEIARGLGIETQLMIRLNEEFPVVR